MPLPPVTAEGIETLAGETHRDLAKMQMEIFKGGLRFYHLHMGSYPTTEQGLSALRERPSDVSDPAKWRGPYLQGEIRLDPWDNEYRYELSSPTAYRVWSCGPDEKDGTEDDVVLQETSDSN
jgi:general secretion pathway protein G